MTNCADCHTDTLPTDWHHRAEYYSVHAGVWANAGMTSGFLCIGCLERRLDRRLTRDDFDNAAVNDLRMSDIPRYAWTFRTPTSYRSAARLRSNPIGSVRQRNCDAVTSAFAVHRVSFFYPRLRHTPEQFPHARGRFWLISSLLGGCGRIRRIRAWKPPATPESGSVSGSTVPVAVAGPASGPTSPPATGHRRRRRPGGRRRSRLLVGGGWRAGTRLPTPVTARV
jgi:hypothetical protein